MAAHFSPAGNATEWMYPCMFHMPAAVNEGVGAANTTPQRSRNVAFQWPKTTRTVEGRFCNENSIVVCHRIARVTKRFRRSGRRTTSSREHGIWESRATTRASGSSWAVRATGTARANREIRGTRSGTTGERDFSRPHVSGCQIFTAAILDPQDCVSCGFAVIETVQFR
jgi:hypothetical protein